MIRSLNSAVSGMKNHQTRLDVIANNVANVNTFGFKASRVTFKDIFSQTTKGAGSGTDVLGGTNPRQIGLGVTVSSIDMPFSGTGSAYTTDNLWDLMIQGDGLFIVAEGVDNNTSTEYLRHYTRAGNFTVSPNAIAPDLFDLVTADGMFVLGIMGEIPPSTDKATVDSTDIDTDLTAIQIPNNVYNISIDQQGYITAVNASSEIVYIARVATAQFANGDGLTKIGNNKYDESTNSGIAIYTWPGDMGSGAIESGALEMSNVNLAQEFSDLITTQRGYQANARIITVSDTILEELINLKR